MLLASVSNHEMVYCKLFMVIKLFLQSNPEGGITLYTSTEYTTLKSLSIDPILYDIAANAY